MGCIQSLSGISQACESSLGGIKTCYIANYDDVASVLEGDGIITAITMTNTAKFHKYEFRKGTGSLTSTLNVDESAGVHYYSTVVNLVFSKMQTAKRVEISALAAGQLALIVQDSNNKYWYIGKSDYASATNGSGNTGTAKGDSNNYTLEITAEEDDLPFEVAEAALADIIDK